MFSESVQVASFRAWLAKHGAYIHPDLRFVKDASGMSVHAARDIPPDTTVVSCPFALAITPALAQRSIAAIADRLHDDSVAQLSERELICTYLVMHWILEETQDEGILESTTDFIYLPYLRTLPPPDALRTALHFNERELSLLKGTNLFGVTADHSAERDAEWKRCQNLVRSIRGDWEARFTWTRYLTAATYLSSRAFPSTLLSRTPSLVSSPSSYPVLLPGLDSLNHSRAHRVSWVISDCAPDAPAPAPAPTAPALHVSLVVHPRTPARAEVRNNYGPKPNAELILGYGFSLSSNPDDTIVLRIGGQDGAARARWEVGRGARGAAGLWDELGGIMRGAGAAGWEADLDAAEALQHMTESKLENLPAPPAAAPPGVRSDVLAMIQHYVRGQREVLCALSEFADGKREGALARARDEGVDLVFADEASDSGAS